jgi:hypothetical protein
MGLRGWGRRRQASAMVAGPGVAEGARLEAGRRVFLKKKTLPHMFYLNVQDIYIIFR